MSSIFLLLVLMLLLLSSDIFFKSSASESPLPTDPKSGQYALTGETFNSSWMNFQNSAYFVSIEDIIKHLHARSLSSSIHQIILNWTGFVNAC